MRRKLIVKVLVDVTNDFVIGGFGSQAALDAIPAMAEFLTHDDSYTVISYSDEEDADIIMVATRDNHGKDYTKSDEYRKYKIIHGEEDTEGFNFYRDIQRIVDANKNNPRFSIIEKDANMPYGREEDFINAMKKANLYEGHEKGENVEFIIGGLVTDICVILTAGWLYAAFPLATVVVNAKASVGCTSELHDKALDVMESMTIKVINR